VHDAELVSLRVGKDSPRLSAGLPDVDPARPERNKAVNLLIAVRGAADEHVGSMRGTLDRIRKPAVLPRTGRSPEVTPRDSARIV